MATLIRDYNWSLTKLGPLPAWPDHLKTAVDMVLQSPVPMVMLWGGDGTLIYNDAYARFAGNRHPHLLGRPVAEAWPEIADFNRAILARVLGGETPTFENRHLLLDRHGEFEDVWCDLYYSPVLDMDGVPAGVLAIVVETTQRVKSDHMRQTMEEAFHNSEERYQVALEASELVGTWSWDLDTDLVICDERFAHLYQVDAERAKRGVPLDHFLRVIHPDDLGPVQRAIENTIHHRTEFKTEYRLLQPQGAISWVNARGRCHYGEQGKPLRFLGVVIDITERKQIEHIIDGQRHALEQSIHNEPLSAILNTVIRTVETQSRNKVVSSIFLIDDDGCHLRYGAAPSLSPDYIDAIDGLAIDSMNSSCAAAACRRHEIFVDDVMTDPIWSGLTELARQQGFRSCWSMPLISSHGVLLGTFALYYPDVRHPSAEDRGIVQLLSHTAILVIERHADNQTRLVMEKQQSALIELGDRLRGLKDISAITATAMEIVGQTLGVARTGYGIVDASEQNVTIEHDWTDGTVQSLAGIHHFSHYGAELAASLKRGDILAIADTLNSTVMSGGAEKLKATQVASLINVPLIEKGRLAAIFYIHDATPRMWTNDEIAFVRNVADRTWAAAEQASAERELRESEQHYRLLNELSDATRTVNDPAEVMGIVTRLVGRHFNAERCAYADVMPDQNQFTIPHDYVASDVPSIVGHHALDRFGTRATHKMRSGRTLVINNVASELAADDIGFATFLDNGIQAIICCPLIKNHRLSAMMAVHSRTPRPWTKQDIALFEAVTERCWVFIERARADTRLRESEQRFRQLANAMPQVVWTAQADGHMDYINDRSLAYSGPLPERDGIIKWAAIVYPDDLKHTTETWSRSIRSGEPYEVQQRIYHKDSDEYRWNLTLALPVRDTHGAIITWLGTNTDIEEQIRNAQALSEARDQAQQANIAKSEFLANMSHEIRTPMNAVIGLSNILSNSDPLTPRQREFIHTLQLSADSLLALLNDLLDISKIEARTVELEHIPFSVEKMLQEIISMMNVRVTEKGLAFILHANNAAGRMFIGDPVRIRQIILNLCSNAIKFTETGGVRIDVTCEPADDDTIETISIAVTDTGIGIAPDKQKTIFDKFVQADSSINRKYGGTGLGLAITKTLTEIMGGTITLTSEPGAGSTFTVRLPLAVSHEAPPAAPPAPAPTATDPVPDGPLVLLVEDYAPNVLVAGNYLEQFGYAYDVAGNGLAAVDAVRSKRYAAILMDVQMHGLNGFEATRFIRQYEKDQRLSRTPIIGMTAHALAGDRERCLSAGMDDYLSKPFNAEHLQNLLQRLTGDTP